MHNIFFSVFRFFVPSSISFLIPCSNTLTPDHHASTQTVFLFLLFISDSLYFLPAMHYFSSSTLISPYHSSLPAHAFFGILSNISFLHFILLYYHLCVIVLSHVYIPPVLTSLCSSIHLSPTFCMNILPNLHFVTPSTFPPFYILHIKICNILMFNFWTCIMKYLLQNKCLKNCIFICCVSPFAPTSLSSTIITVIRVGVGIFNVALEVSEMKQVSRKYIITTKFM